MANKTYDEGAIVPRGCGQECLCQNSTVVCHTVEVQCNIQDSVLLPSEFCPIPVIVKGPDECCPRWECHPAGMLPLENAVACSIDHMANFQPLNREKSFLLHLICQSKILRLRPL